MNSYFDMVYAFEEYFILFHIKHVLSVQNFQKGEENIPSSVVYWLSP